jgi:ATP-binding cassette subfamily F protein uup
MDEPTNDLDLETLELLEEKLVEFGGTLLLVSHDRAFLDNVVTSIFVLDGTGEVEEFIGGYSDWLEYSKQLKQTQAQAKKTQDTAKKEKPAASATAPAKKKKLSYKEQQELNNLPVQIEELENKQAALTEQTAAPDFYKQDKKTVAKTLDELNALEIKLEETYSRWNELEARMEENTE